IGPNAFMGCSALESIVIPEGVENLPLNVFTNCANLRSVTIPGSVTEIAYNAFSGCEAVRDIYLYADPEMLTWNAGELNGTGYFKKDRGTKCHVLPERLDDYEAKFGTGAKKPVNVTFAGDLQTGQRFTVSFNTMGGSAIPSQTVEPGGRVSAPDRPPVKEGFTFAGWFSDESCSQKFLFSYPIREDTTAYAKWIEHIHSFTYSADGATITAGCSAENCPLPEHQAIITLNPPTHETYGDGKAAEALINGDTDVLGSPAVTYRNGAERLEQAPTDAGSYTAQITVGGETVSIAYTIAPKTVSSPRITLEYAEKEYTGEALTPAVLSVCDGEEVIPADEYEIGYYNNTNIGNAAVLLRDREGGNYLVNGTASFKITAARAAITTLPRTASLTYNGSPQALLLAGASNSENGVEYSTNGKSFGSSIPKQTKPGTYAVYYRAAADEAHLAGDINRLDAVIDRAPLTVSGASAQNRSYNGEKTVVITAVEIKGVIGTEDVSVDTAGLTGTLSSAEAGSYTTVTLPALSLIGEDAGNYVLRQPSRAVPTAAEITPISETTITVRTTSYQKQYLDPAFLLTGISANVSADIELAVTEGADVIALSGRTVSILKPGAAVITASIAATKNHKGAEAEIMVNVAKAEYPKPQPSASLSVPSSCRIVGDV
ncbi:MAG: InlB B-repeat-containing protein, partial [Oscillospiraceae bacterium]|nr:InlB B-repeat-containing protein [Oscillospiraceae bacterium]